MNSQRSFGCEQLSTIRTDQSVHVGMYIPAIIHHSCQNSIFSNNYEKWFLPVVDLYHGLNNIGITELADHDVRIALDKMSVLGIFCGYLLRVFSTFVQMFFNLHEIFKVLASLYMCVQLCSNFSTDLCNFNEKLSYLQKLS